jgi:D-alanyl-D-alanine carboxypeptidase
MSKVPDWWAIPYDQRLHPPMALVSAFEKQGFTWGGKWFFFDTMHFEYRPEILRMRSTPESRASSDDEEAF